MSLSISTGEPKLVWYPSPMLGATAVAVQIVRHGNLSTQPFQEFPTLLYLPYFRAKRRATMQLHDPITNRIQ